MTAKEYILRELENLVESFPQVRVRYECDQRIDVHFVEVIPNDVYRLNDAYIEWEDEMTTKFIESFPTQNICFISDDALVGIRDTEYILEGVAFAPISEELIFNVIASEGIKIEQTYTAKVEDKITREKELFWDFPIPTSPNYQLAA